MRYGLGGAGLAVLVLGAVPLVLGAASLGAEARTIHISKRYLNVPIADKSKMGVFAIQVGGVERREFPAQLADGTPDYWVFLDVSEFKGQTITLAGPSPEAALGRIYQSNKIEGAATLYRERNRPQFHFTVKRGWSNDVNGPIFYKGQYHLFWQAFPFGTHWDTGFMYWGHAVSKDLIHWRELAPALMLDRLGAVWSGTSFVDRDNAGGWGKGALVVAYTAFDRKTRKQVQCLAYSTDDGKTFTRYAGNPVLDTNDEVGSKDTRDPKVFWYAPTKHWVMVLFEKDGLSVFNSTDLKVWTRKSHFKGLYECPDLFELPVDGDAKNKRWVLHGGSWNYYIGSFDGETFRPESGELRYAEGKNLHGSDALYAAQSFVDMPDGRRVQMAWGRMTPEGMPFNQMILFPTEMKLVTTPEGLRMRATPIAEIERLHGTGQALSSLTVAQADAALDTAGMGPLDVKMTVSVAKGDELALQYGGSTLATIRAAELKDGKGSVEVLIDKAVAEIFVDEGARYIVRETSTAGGGKGLELGSGDGGTTVSRLEIFKMKSIWGGRRGEVEVESGRSFFEEAAGAKPSRKG
jgi:fructan beta-fructosidase